MERSTFILLTVVKLHSVNEAQEVTTAIMNEECMIVEIRKVLESIRQ